MDKAIQKLEYVGRRLGTVRQRLLILRVSRPELGDICDDLAEVLDDINDLRTIARNWKEQAEQDGLQLPEE